MVTTGYPICSVNVFIMFGTFVPSPAAVLAYGKDQTMHSVIIILINQFFF